MEKATQGKRLLKITTIASVVLHGSVYALGHIHDDLSTCHRLFSCRKVVRFGILLFMRHLTLHGKIVVFGSASLFLTIVLLIGMGIRQIERTRKKPASVVDMQTEETVLAPPPVIWTPVRPVPSSFRRNTHRPTQSEANVSGSRDPEGFSAGRDLVYVEDSRVFWESDNDKNDDECDHSMHHAMEAPLRLLIELVHAAGGTLEVHDAYRSSGIHNARSLHKEGRAIDLTCDELGLEKLACLCWAAGFDWVYYEASARGGAHVHCSVKSDHKQPLTADNKQQQ